ncbi:FG-GAP-like repeat-containing protein [Lysobacter sp. Hz 25]|uniref:FG-GAP-like repeat-containing protein n=1 Tax=Lysobacter sp. Hz 25 TaxID=3383698 RepID=UPI0038D473FC
MRTITALTVGAFCAAFSSASPGADITTVAGGGRGGSYATRVELTYPQNIAITPAGEIYLAEAAIIRHIAPDGRTRVIAGTGTMGYAGDGMAAIDAQLNVPGAIAIDAAGNVYIADTYNQRIRKIDTGGIIHTVAGTGVAGAASDGIATQSPLNYPTGLAIGPDGLLYIADTRNHVIRRLDADGRLTTVAGSGAGGSSGEGVPALQAALSSPHGLAFDAAGALYIADTGSARVRKLGTDGLIVTVAGGGAVQNGSVALEAKLDVPRSVAVDANGQLFVLESEGSRLRRVKDGAIATVAGRANIPGFGGDGGDATEALVKRPYGVATDSDGNAYIADTENNRVRKVALASRGLPRHNGSTLLPQAALPVPGTATLVEVGDVTGDGRDDIVVATGYGDLPNAPLVHKVVVYARQAGGGLAAPVSASYENEFPYGKSDMALADLNGDGIQDILIGMRSGVSVFLGSRDGTLAGRHFPLPSLRGLGGSLAVMDVNRDGKPDVVHQVDDLGDSNGSDYNVLLGSGDGRLGAATPIATTVRGGAKILAADLTDDGIEDIVAVSSSSNRVFMFEHDGGSGFKPAQEMLWSNIMEINVGDFDDDQYLDLVSAYYNSPYDTIVVERSQAGALEYIPAPHAFADSQVADLDGDRRDDLVTLASNRIAVYQQTDFGLSEETAYPAPGARDLATGDVNGDGCRDVVAASNTEGLLIYYGQQCKPSALALGDIDGDNRSDLLWRDDARQHVAIWKMDGAARVEGIGHAVPPDWRVLATGDFQGDRQLDLVWTNGTQMQLWEGLGNGHFRGEAMADYPAGWRVVAVGDINGDGNADLLWRNESNTAAALWAMKGPQVIASASYVTSPDWWVAGSGDLSGDGRLDVIWTNGQQMQLWRAGAGLGFVGDAMPDYPQGWELTAAGDVSGDGRADLMWRHPELGHFAVWAMDGGTRVYGRGYQPGPTWRVAQTGDFSGDGRTDIVWSNGSVMQLWQSQGDGFIGVEMPAYPTGWSVIRR